MNRRTTLATLMGRRTKAVSEVTVAASPVTAAPPMNTGLEPYTGPWEYEQAAHLLKRTTFGPTYAQMKAAADSSMEEMVNTLLSDLPLPEPPLNYFTDEDPNVPVGETWINAPYVGDLNLQGPRRRSLAAWTMGLMQETGTNIREKMVLFWHNHYVTALTPDPKFVYVYSNTLRENALGNFRELTKKITIDPAMLIYLNGRQNTRVAPNENYARELLELFTIGKGDLAGPGDYTTFTEDDVVEIARVLTGWRDRGLLTQNPDLEVGSFFRPNAHDLGTKQLSHRFDNAIIENNGEQEYADLIDIIFQQDEVARFISRKLYRWFVYYTIDEQIEADVIEPMAQILIENDYEIKPVLEALFKSAHFYDILNRGPMIKNPLDFVMSVVNQFELIQTNNPNLKYRIWGRLFNLTEPLQMVYYNPPDVAGWKAYYQEPGYYRIWINSATLPVRMEFTNILSTVGATLGDLRIIIDVLSFTASLDDPYDPNHLIEEFVQILFPQPITDGQKTALKEILIPGLPDYEWSIEYGDYVLDPDNMDLATSVENKLRSLVRAMLTMPEFYLS